jgi:hypothetical protein
MTRIVLDPCERGSELALDVAARVRDRLGAGAVSLTREDLRPLSILDRVRVAREAGAGAFVAIDRAESAAEPDLRSWVHVRASIASRLLAHHIVPARPPVEAPLPLLDPDLHAPDCAACLVELPSLAGPADREIVADAIARGVSSQDLPIELHRRRERFDLWHEVPLVQQLTGMSCWAACAAMLVGWRDCIEIDAEEVARGSGRWHAYSDGLEPKDVEAFARAWGLVVARPREISVPELRRLVEDHGPLWVGEASPGLHVIVIAGMYGDGTPEGTFVRIADPWPIGRGERYTIRFSELRRNLLAAAAISGGQPQFLHSAPGARGATRQSFSHQEFHYSVSPLR